MLVPGDIGDARPAGARPAPGRRAAALKAFALEPRNVGWILVALSVVAALQEYLLGPKMLGDGLYTHYNNYVIFARSFVHLVHGQDLYVRYPAEYWDLYKYSPTFAALMAPFSALPDLAGLVLWNVLNAAVFVLALSRLPVLTPRSKALLGLLLVPEFLTSVQNTQANVLVAGLVVLSFELLEQDRPGWAALPIALGVVVKVYPVVGALMFLLYPRKLRFLAALAGWCALLAAVPLLLVSAGHLRDLYASWLRLLLEDHATLANLSVMAWLRAWAGLDPPKDDVVLVGAVVLLLPATNVAARGRPMFRLLFLASILVWMVVFNHMAESATYFIAMCGVGIWYFARPRGRLEGVLLGLAFLFTSMSPRFPGWMIDAIVRPYVLKAVPCILIWFAIIRELAWLEGEEPARAAPPSPRLAG